MKQPSIPSPDEIEDLLLSCRYGDLDDVKTFIDNFGTSPLTSSRDEHGNTILHMASANGHTELLDLLLPLSSPTLLSVQNNAGSTALHWAAINAQLPAARTLVAFPDGPGARLIDVKNAAGRSPLGEAEAAGWDEGAKWMVEVMHLDDTSDDDNKNGGDGGGAIEEEDGEELGEQPNAAVEEGPESGSLQP